MYIQMYRPVTPMLHVNTLHSRIFETVAWTLSEKKTDAVPDSVFS